MHNLPEKHIISLPYILNTIAIEFSVFPKLFLNPFVNKYMDIHALFSKLEEH